VKPISEVVWRGENARKQTSRLEGRVIAPHLMGIAQKKENESECLDIEKREGSREWRAADL
jgi:hypothetical protein